MIGIFHSKEREAVVPCSLETAKSLAHLISRASSGIWQLSTLHTYPQGEVTGMQAGVLSLLAYGNGLTSAELARHYKLRPSTIARVVDRLVDLGLVHRDAGGANRRVAYVRVTEKGGRLAEELRPALERALGLLVDGIEPGDIIALQRCLKRMMLNVRAAEEANPALHEVSWQPRHR